MIRFVEHFTNFNNMFKGEYVDFFKCIDSWGRQSFCQEQVAHISEFSL